MDGKHTVYKIQNVSLTLIEMYTCSIANATESQLRDLNDKYISDIKTGRHNVSI